MARLTGHFFMNEKEYRAALSADPGAPLFVEFAEYLRGLRRQSEAIDVCLAGLSANPDAHRGRLMLARVFYECGFVPFAVRELQVLGARFPENRALAKLRERLSPNISQQDSAGESEVAEAEFDIDAIGLIAADRKK